MSEYPVRVYIAGPMTGYPQFNIPAFDAMARMLRKQVAGPKVRTFDVVSPAELDGEEVREHLLKSKTGDPADLPPGTTWGDFLARDVKLIADGGIKAIVTLDGWERSRGARLETFVGHLAGCQITKGEITWDGYHITLWQHPRSTLLRAWEGVVDEVDECPRCGLTFLQPHQRTMHLELAHKEVANA